jgi:hypothetical protein
MDWTGAVPMRAGAVLIRAVLIRAGAVPSGELP